jgi:hypothetical protein
MHTTREVSALRMTQPAREARMRRSMADSFGAAVDRECRKVALWRPLK